MGRPTFVNFAQIENITCAGEFYCPPRYYCYNLPSPGCRCHQFFGFSGPETNCSETTATNAFVILTVTLTTLYGLYVALFSLFTIVQLKISGALDIKAASFIVIASCLGAFLTFLVECIYLNILAGNDPTYFHLDITRVIIMAFLTTFYSASIFSVPTVWMKVVLTTTNPPPSTRKLFRQITNLIKAATFINPVVFFVLTYLDNLRLVSALLMLENVFTAFAYRFSSNKLLSILTLGEEGSDNKSSKKAGRDIETIVTSFFRLNIVLVVSNVIYVVIVKNEALGFFHMFFVQTFFASVIAAFHLFTWYVRKGNQRKLQRAGYRVQESFSLNPLVPIRGASTIISKRSTSSSVGTRNNTASSSSVSPSSSADSSAVSSAVSSTTSSTNSSTNSSAQSDVEDDDAWEA